MVNLIDPVILLLEMLFQHCNFEDKIDYLQLANLFLIFWFIHLTKNKLRYSVDYLIHMYINITHDCEIVIILTNCFIDHVC